MQLLNSLLLTLIIATLFATFKFCKTQKLKTEYDHESDLESTSIDEHLRRHKYGSRTSAIRRKSASSKTLFKGLQMSLYRLKDEDGDDMDCGLQKGPRIQEGGDVKQDEWNVEVHQVLNEKPIQKPRHLYRSINEDGMVEGGSRSSTSRNNKYLCHGIIVAERLVLVRAACLMSGGEVPQGSFYQSSFISSESTKSTDELLSKSSFVPSTPPDIVMEIDHKTPLTIKLGDTTVEVVEKSALPHTKLFVVLILESYKERFTNMDIPIPKPVCLGHQSRLGRKAMRSVLKSAKLTGCVNCQLDFEEHLWILTEHKTDCKARQEEEHSSDEHKKGVESDNRHGHTGSRETRTSEIWHAVAEDMRGGAGSRNYQHLPEKKDKQSLPGGLDGNIRKINIKRVKRDNMNEDGGDLDGGFDNGGTKFTVDDVNRMTLVHRSKSFNPEVTSAVDKDETRSLLLGLKISSTCHRSSSGRMVRVTRYDSVWPHIHDILAVNVPDDAGHTPQEQREIDRIFSLSHDISKHHESITHIDEPNNEETIEHTSDFDNEDEEVLNSGGQACPIVCWNSDVNEYDCTGPDREDMESTQDLPLSNTIHSICHVRECGKDADSNIFEHKLTISEAFLKCEEVYSNDMKQRIESKVGEEDGEHGDQDVNGDPSDVIQSEEGELYDEVNTEGAQDLIERRKRGDNIPHSKFERKRERLSKFNKWSQDEGVRRRRILMMMSDKDQDEEDELDEDEDDDDNSEHLRSHSSKHDKYGAALRLCNVDNNSKNKNWNDSTRKMDCITIENGICIEIKDADGSEDEGSDDDEEDIDDDDGNVEVRKTSKGFTEINNNPASQISFDMAETVNMHCVCKNGYELSQDITFSNNTEKMLKCEKKTVIGQHRIHTDTCTTIEGVRCIFPFMWEGRLVDHCINEKSDDEQSVTVGQCPIKLDPETLKPIAMEQCSLFCPLTNYHTHQELKSDLRRLTVAFPAHAKLFDLGETIKRRSIRGIRLTHSINPSVEVEVNENVLSVSASQHHMEEDAEEPEVFTTNDEEHEDDIYLRPKVKLVGNMHGNEPVGRELLIYLARHLLHSAYLYKNPRMLWLMKHTDIYILPTLNPDGFARGRAGDCNAGNYRSGRLNENRKDLNRNFPSFSDYVDLHSNSKCHNYIDCEPLFKGREVETQVAMNWILSNNFVLSANFHDGATLVNYPWDEYHYPGVRHGIAMTRDHDVFYNLSTTYSFSHRYMNDTMALCPYWGSFKDGVTNGADWYIVKGGMQDFNYLFASTMELTIEISCCKYPNRKWLIQEWLNNEESFLKLLERAHLGIKGQIMDKNGEPIKSPQVRIRVRKLKRRKGISGVSGLIYEDWRPSLARTDARGNYWRLLLDGEYQVQALILNDEQFFAYGKTLDLVEPPRTEAASYTVGRNKSMHHRPRMTSRTGSRYASDSHYRAISDVIDVHVKNVAGQTAQVVDIVINHYINPSNDFN